MSILSRLFKGVGKGAKLYPHPAIDLFYICECGTECNFRCQSVDFESGVNITCYNCGAVTHVPPTIFNRRKPHFHDPSGAKIHSKWYLRLKPPRPF